MNDSTTTSDESGVFEFKEAIGDVEHYLTVVLVGKFGKIKSTQMLVAPGETWEVGNLALPSADKIVEGAVKGEDGKPIIGAGIISRGESTGEKQVSSDQNGHFRIENLVIEKIEISASYRTPTSVLFGIAYVLPDQTNLEIILKPETLFR